MASRQGSFPMQSVREGVSVENQGLTPTAWYRHRWPWILMAGPAIVIAAGIVTTWLAVSSFDGLIAEDYYKQGLAVNRVLARAGRAASLGIDGRFALNAAHNGAIEVRLSSATGVLPDEVRLSLSHPTRSGLDQRVVLVTTSGGIYRGHVAPLAAGRWRVIVEDAAGEWRIAGELRFPQERDADLKSGG